MKPCPYCAESIQDEAKKCRFCGEWLEDQQAEPVATSPTIGDVEMPTEEDLAESKMTLGEREVTGRQAFLVIGLLLLFVVVIWNLNSAPRSSRGSPPRQSLVSVTPRPSASTPTSRPKPRPKLNLEVTGCERSGSYLQTEGYVQNTGTITVHFVTVDLRWRDSAGQTVDTGWTYAVGSEHLRPGERSEFTDSTRHRAASRCVASVRDFRMP